MFYVHDGSQGCGFWGALSSTQAAALTRGSGRVKWRVNVPDDGEAVVTHTVRYNL